MSAGEAQQLQQLLDRHSGDASLWRRLGNALQAENDLQGAARAYRESLRLEPSSVRGHNNLGQVLQGLGEHGSAEACYRQAIALDGRYAIAHNNLGILRHESGDYVTAAQCFERALELQPDFALAHHNFSTTLLKLGHAAAAFEHCEQALASGSIETWYTRGVALQELARHEEALECYDRVLVARPAHTGALRNSAANLLVLQRVSEALERTELALAADPAMAEAHGTRADALMQLNRLEDADEAYARAAQLKPDFAHAWLSLGLIRHGVAQSSEALRYFRQARSLQPDLVDARPEYAAALMAGRAMDEAIAALERRVRLDPQAPYLQGHIREARSRACDWGQLAQDRAALSRDVEAGLQTVQPFCFLWLNDSPSAQLRCAQAYARSFQPGPQEGRSAPVRSSSTQRLKLAYLSADFHSHATTQLMAGVFEAHDHSRFETMAVSFGPPDQGSMRQRLERAFDHFTDVRRLDDAAVVRMLREAGVDIAIDLKGYTTDMRAGLFTRRVAPIQISYLGYPGTLGMSQMDYLIADRLVLPLEQAQYYTEKVVWMPDSYQCNDNTRAIAERTPSRTEAGLPESGFVFCCFNNNHKITPEVFDVWMSLLSAVPGSVLWLLGDNEAAMRNLRREAQARGADPERLVFAARVDVADHLARQRLADLFLDTLPYNAHTTASDALWAGVPVLTCLGRSFAGRVGASLLHAVGLPEMVAGSLAEYQSRAEALARNPVWLAAIRARLARNRLTHSLFDTRRFTRHLESAYETLWQRHTAGLPAQSFEVSA